MGICSSSDDVEDSRNERYRQRREKRLKEMSQRRVITQLTLRTDDGLGDSENGDEVSGDTVTAEGATYSEEPRRSTPQEDGLRSLPSIRGGNNTSKQDVASQHQEDSSAEPTPALWAKAVVSHGSIRTVESVASSPTSRCPSLFQFNSPTGQGLAGSGFYKPDFVSESGAYSAMAENGIGSQSVASGSRSMMDGSASMFSGQSSSVATDALLRRQQRLERSLDQRRVSDGNLATEPSQLSEQLKQKALVARARLVNGITSDPNQFQRIIDAESARCQRLPAETRLRFCEWIDDVIECMLDLPQQDGDLSQTDHGSSVGVVSTVPADHKTVHTTASRDTDDTIPLQAAPVPSQASPPPAVALVGVTSPLDVSQNQGNPMLTSPMSRRSSEHSVLFPHTGVLESPLQSFKTTVTFSITVEGYEVKLTTANLAPLTLPPQAQRGSVISVASMPDQPASPRSQPRSSPAYHRLEASHGFIPGLVDDESNSRGWGATPQPEMSRDHIDEVDQLIFGSN